MPSWTPGIRGILGILVVILAIVFAAIGKLDMFLAALFVALGIAVLL